MTNSPIVPREKKTRCRGRYHYRQSVIDVGTRPRPFKFQRTYGDWKITRVTWDERVTIQRWKKGCRPAHVLQVAISAEDGATFQSWAQECGMSPSVFMAYLMHLYKSKMLVIVPDGFAIEDIYDQMFSEVLGRRLRDIDKEIRKRFAGLEDEIRKEWMTFRE